MMFLGSPLIEGGGGRVMGGGQCDVPPPITRPP